MESVKILKLYCYQKNTKVQKYLECDYDILTVNKIYWYGKTILPSTKTATVSTSFQVKIPEMRLDVGDPGSSECCV
jgi:hypothetical protein